MDVVAQALRAGCALQALACRTFVGQASAVAAIRLDERLPEDAPDPFTR